MLRNPTLAVLASVTGGEIIQGDPEAFCTSVSTDTRTLSEGSLYIPLTGERFDGHDFVQNAVDAGATAVLTERLLPVTIAQIKVNNTLRALADVAAWHRDQFTGPVVAVTGSAGKTTVKQLMGSVLSQRYQTLITQGNLNNHIGAPLTLLSLRPEHEAAMIELGASGVGEINYTASLVKPQVGILTNVVPVHLEGFGSVDNIASTKGELIDAVASHGVMVLNADDKYFSQWLGRVAERSVISFGLSPDADVYATDIQEEITGTRFTFHLNGNAFPVSMSLSGKHNVRNALSVIAAASALDFRPEEIVAGLESALPVSGRLEQCTGQQGQMVLNDAYNANPESFRAAIDVLALAAGKRIVVMGDMGELGEAAEDMHAQTGHYAKEKGIEVFAATGSLSQAAVDAFGENGHWFEDQKSLIEFLKETPDKTDTLLVKGSRSAGMDRVVRALTEEKEEN